jgi:hypothetical protein
MEPTLVIPEKLKSVLEELQRLEPLFHAANAEASPSKFEELVAPEFWEVGASGRRYSREFALSVLQQRAPPDADAWRTADFHVVEAGMDNYLLTYTLYQPERVTRRLTVWRRCDAGWKAIYHQGTVVAEH